MSADSFTYFFAAIMLLTYLQILSWSADLIIYINSKKNLGIIS